MLSELSQSLYAASAYLLTVSSRELATFRFHPRSSFSRC